jgi:predicted site-specific integrase-resolvase
MTEEHWITAAEAARRIGVHRDTVRRWVRGGMVKERAYNQRIKLVYWPDVERVAADPPKRGRPFDK